MPWYKWLQTDTSWQSLNRHVTLTCQANLTCWPGLKIINAETDQKGSFLQIDVNVQGKNITLANVYGQNKDYPKLFADVQKR